MFSDGVLTIWALHHIAPPPLDAGLVGHEIPRHAILTTDEWTVENGSLTSSLKICRPVLMQRYTKHDRNTPVEAAGGEAVVSVGGKLDHAKPEPTTAGSPVATALPPVRTGTNLSSRIGIDALKHTTQEQPHTNLSSQLKERLAFGFEQVLRETIPSLACASTAMPRGDQTVYMLGVDSLAMAVLRAALQTRFRIDIPLTHLASVCSLFIFV